MQYGTCQNFEGNERTDFEPCPAYLAKTTVSLPDEAEFVCPECGEALEVTKRPPPLWKYALIAAGAVLIALGGYATLSGGLPEQVASLFERESRGTTNPDSSDRGPGPEPRPRPLPDDPVVEDPRIGLTCRTVGWRCPDAPPEDSLTALLAREVQPDAELLEGSTTAEPVADGEWQLRGTLATTSAAVAVPIVALTLDGAPDVVRRNAARLRPHPTLPPGRTVDAEAATPTRRPRRETVRWTLRAVRDGSLWRVSPLGPPSTRPAGSAAARGTTADTVWVSTPAEVDSLVAERDRLVADLDDRWATVQQDIATERRRLLASVPTIPGRRGGCPDQELRTLSAEVIRLARLCPTVPRNELADCEARLASQNRLLRACQLRRGSPSRQDPAAAQAARRNADAYAQRRTAEFERSITPSP